MAVRIALEVLLHCDHVDASTREQHMGTAYAGATTRGAAKVCRPLRVPGRGRFTQKLVGDTSSCIVLYCVPKQSLLQEM